MTIEEENCYYSREEQKLLLNIARAALTAAAEERVKPWLDLEALPPKLREERACFVTLNEYGDLRGCTGTLYARRPLAQEVNSTTIQTALSDPRFEPVRAEEVPHIQIEISVLTPPTRLEFRAPVELLRQLRPNIDGVLIQSVGGHRATLLPQVWERYPNPADFLSVLCQKAGLPANAWQRPGLFVDVYQAIVFEEHAPSLD